jgi:hypothetical protein
MMLIEGILHLIALGGFFIFLPIFYLIRRLFKK